MTELHSEFDVVTHPSGKSISAAPLNQFPWLRHASTLRSFSYPETPRMTELREMQKHLDADSKFLVHGEQKHTANVGVVDDAIVASAGSEDYFRFPSTDALVCPVPGVTIAIMTADCAPIFLVDPVARIIALAHAGWKGTLAQIARRTVETMVSLGSKDDQIIAWVGPMAGGCCYEVSIDLIEKFQSEFPGWPVAASTSERHLDLVDINCRILEASGLTASNIHRSNICTIHNCDSFYSYRGDNGTHGRIISAMVISR